MSVGKNFSANNVTGKRSKNDAYPTPYSMTRQLFEVPVNISWDANKTVLEPSCGEGHMVSVLKENFNNIVSYDKYVGEDTKDFLDETEKYPYIITNPPFSLALEFIKKCMEIATERFCLLLPLSYLHGQTRYNERIFMNPDFPLDSVNIFTRYPMLSETLKADGTYKTGMMVYAWMIWDKNTANEKPVIGWIDNHQYISYKNENKKPKVVDVVHPREKEVRYNGRRD